MNERQISKTSRPHKAVIGWVFAGGTTPLGEFDQFCSIRRTHREPADPMGFPDARRARVGSSSNSV